MPPKKSTTATKAATKAAPAKTTTTKAPPVKAAPKKTTTTKKAPTKNTSRQTKKVAKDDESKVAPPTAPSGRKRKAESETPAEPVVNGRKNSTASTSSNANTKKRKADDSAPSTLATKKSRTVKPKAIINHAPAERLHVFTFGTGDTGGELGLGPKSLVVKRPRLNPHLLAREIGVVQVACGGMHCAALTHDNKIYTWGVNDHGALGRDTTWEGGLKDMDENDSDEDSEEAEMNPYESTPAPVDQTSFPENTRFTQLACCDSSTFALTEDGLVYGWGTFKSSDGVIGFSPESLIQTKPTLVPNLKKVTKLVSGGNHVLALSTTGQVFAWGSGEKNQLGRRIVERTKQNGLIPREFGLPKGITDISAGSYHNFALHERTGKVFAWGLNNFGQTGIPEGVGEDEAVVLHPSVIKSLSAKGDTKVTNIDGGEHHSIAVQADGACLTWGRLDGYQSGVKIETLSESDIIKDERGNVRILKYPTQVPGFEATYGCAGSRHTIAVARDGKAYSWGTNNTYQCGQGHDNDVEVATHIDNTAVRGKQLNWAGASAQFSALTALATAEDVAMVNGV